MFTNGIAQKTLMAGAIAALAFATTSVQAQVSKSELRAIKAPSAPVLDGKVDDIWSKAPELSIDLAGGHITQDHKLTVRAMYDAENIYFLYRWNDPTESLIRKSWQKQPIFHQSMQQIESDWQMFKAGFNHTDDANSDLADK